MQGVVGSVGLMVLNLCLLCQAQNNTTTTVSPTTTPDMGCPGERPRYKLSWAQIFYLSISNHVSNIHKSENLRKEIKKYSQMRVHNWLMSTIGREVWWSSGQSPCLQIARPGFDSRPGASPQCGLRGGRSHCNTV